MGKAIGLALVLSLARADAAPAQTYGKGDSPKVAEAFALCQQGTSAPAPQAAWLLARGLEAAEAAVAADETDAHAHLAVVCNLGRQLERARVSFRSFGAVGRLKREVDRAVELAPEDPDALAAKGGLLLRLPRLLGGDVDEAERLLGRAVTIAPEHATAWYYLARLREGRGDDEAARAAAEKALGYAEHAGLRWEATQARLLLDDLAS
jgi:tetratricopeptide (TPR) repeat protein